MSQPVFSFCFFFLTFANIEKTVISLEAQTSAKPQSQELNILDAMFQFVILERTNMFCKAVKEPEECLGKAVAVDSEQWKNITSP